MKTSTGDISKKDVWRIIQRIEDERNKIRRMGRDDGAKETSLGRRTHKFNFVHQIQGSCSFPSVEVTTEVTRTFHYSIIVQ